MANTDPTNGAAGNDPTGEPIVLGNVGTTSVPGKPEPLQRAVKGWAAMQAAVKVWVELVNSNGGIAGRPLRLETGDDTHDLDKHLELVKEMVENKGVVAFVGMHAFNTQGASVEYLEEKGVPVVGGALGHAAWGRSAVMFPTGVGAQQKPRMLMHAIALSGKTKWGWISPQPEQLAKVFEGGVAAEAGIEMVFEGKINPQDPSGYPELARAAKRSGAEVITIAANFSAIAKAVEAFDDEDFRPTFVMPGTATAQEILDLQGDKLEGAIGVCRTAPWMADRPADLLLYREAMEANGLESRATTLLGWTAGRVLEEALRRVEGEVTPPAVAEALRTLDGEDFDGIIAPLGFSSSPSEPNPGSTCFWPVIAKDGKWTPGDRICFPAKVPALT